MSLFDMFSLSYQELAEVLNRRLPYWYCRRCPASWCPRSHRRLKLSGCQWISVTSMASIEHLRSLHLYSLHPIHIGLEV